MVPPLIVFSRAKSGHYGNWETLFQRLTPCQVERSLWRQFLLCLSGRPIALLDGDSSHLLFFPFVVLRSGMGRKTVLFSIRSELLLEGSFKGFIRASAFRIAKRLPNTLSVSIHKDGVKQSLREFFSHFIYDVQYWDLRYLNIRPIPVQGIGPGCGDSPPRPEVLVFGALNRKRRRSEWMEFLRSGADFGFRLVFAGDSKFTPGELDALKECEVIDKYVSDEEMLFLLRRADYVSVFRDLADARPSGVFGRAVQLGKTVVVEKGGYLHTNHQSYEGLIPIDRLEELTEVIDGLPGRPKIPNFDDSVALKTILTC